MELLKIALIILISIVSAARNCGGVDDALCQETKVCFPLSLESTNRKCVKTCGGVANILCEGNNKVCSKSPTFNGTTEESFGVCLPANFCGGDDAVTCSENENKVCFRPDSLSTIGKCVKPCDLNAEVQCGANKVCQSLELQGLPEKGVCLPKPCGLDNPIGCEGGFICKVLKDSTDGFCRNGTLKGDDSDELDVAVDGAVAAVDETSILVAGDSDYATVDGAVAAVDETSILVAGAKRFLSPVEHGISKRSGLAKFTSEAIQWFGQIGAVVAVLSFLIV